MPPQATRYFGHTGDASFGMTCFKSANTVTRLCLLLLLVDMTLHASERVMNAETYAEDADCSRAEQTEAENLKAIFNYRVAAYTWSDEGKFDKAARALRNAGELLQLLGNSEAAKQNYDEALSFSEKINDQIEAARIHNDLAYLHFLAGENNQAQQHCQTALTVARNFHERSIEAEALSVLGETFYNANLAKAIEVQRQSLAIWRELGQQRGQALSLIALGYYFANAGQRTNALSSCQ